jgi:clan AA aspartic protease
MIRGRVSKQREARLLLTIFAADGRESHLDVVIDTGFDGFLTLPSQFIRRLQLPPAGTRRIILGDGSSVELDTYLGNVTWHDDQREILILQANSDPVVGMALLDGSRVELHVEDDGDVVIEPLP